MTSFFETRSMEENVSSAEIEDISTAIFSIVALIKVTPIKQPENVKIDIDTSNTIVSSRSINTAQKMKFSIKDFFSIYDQSRSFLRIWSHLPKKSLMENFIFRAVK